jgi:dipeptidyl-peptidase 4
MSPDNEYFVDASRAGLPGGSVLRRTKDGSRCVTCDKRDVSELVKMVWKFPEPFQGKAVDGTTDLYGLIWKASNFDPSKKYPIIEQVYAGPQAFCPENAWRCVRPAMWMSARAIHARP